MPTYTYTCICGNKFEEVKPMEYRHGAVCPYCGLLAKLIMSPIGGHIWKNPEPLYHKNGSYQDKY